MPRPRGEMQEGGLRVQAETQLSCTAAWAGEGAPGRRQGGEALGPMGLGTQLPCVHSRALVSSALSPLDLPFPPCPLPQVAGRAVFGREVARPPERPLVSIGDEFPRGLS